MPTAVIIDVVIAAVLVLGVVWGAKKGLFRTLAGLLIILLSLVGAGYAARVGAPAVADLMMPRMEQRVQQQIDEALAQREESLSDGIEGLGVKDLLELIGLDSQWQESMVERAEESVRETGVSVVMAVAREMAESILYGVLFFLSFAALMVLLHLAARAVDLMMKLPVLHTANALLGGVIGLAEAVVLIYLALWLVPHLGWGISTETQEASTLLAFFSDHAPFETFGLFL